ncbi:hypothetical protein [Sulfidibacter corallicola]|uniref:Uncharacterized protein n=1 Tax=Sulfidibacter corallicola TaxID=2818388 RepID=A0A8A4TJQ2_SULCO|nr:hypothetical protein [Sulfidibacter corallicola]QTD49780.1 hypothetical protein J3U87_29710 [Sulfidibacter corallicola]
MDNRHNQASPLLFTVTWDDFADADVANPVYLRLRIIRNVVLSHTLVDIDDPENGRVHRPIFLPLFLTSGAVTDQIAAPPGTLSIVRWVAGEGEIWLRVQSSSSEWIQTGGGTEPPTRFQTMSFSLGIAASQYWALYQPLYAEGRANLPAPTRDPEGRTRADAVSTQICVDVTQSSLQPEPAPPSLSQLQFLPNTYNSETVGITTAHNTSDIFLGTWTPVAFSNDTVIGTARELNVGCTFDAMPTTPTQVSLCPDQANPDGLYRLENHMDLLAGCASPWGFHRGSTFAVHLPSQSDYGFPILLQDGEPVDAVAESGRPDTVLVDPRALQVDLETSQAYAEANSLFTLGDRLFSRTAEVATTGAGTSGLQNARLDLAIWTDGDQPATDVVVRVIVRPSNRDDNADPDPDFSGPDQALFCGPLLSQPLIREWSPGGFLACGFVSMPDPALRERVLAEFDQDRDGQLSLAEADRIERLDVSAFDIVDLTGVQSFRALRELDAAQNLIRILPDLDGLTELARVNLAGNCLEEVSAFVTHPFLGSGGDHALDLSHNRLNDFDIAVCGDLASLTDRWSEGGGTLRYGPQGDWFFGSTTQRWVNGSSGVLDWVTWVNRANGVVAPYEVCP